MGYLSRTLRNTFFLNVGTLSHKYREFAILKGVYKINLDIVYHMSSFTNDVLLAGISGTNTPFTTYAAVMPFINEILNLLTITVFKPQFKIEVYPHDPHTFETHFRKAFIDMLAVTGIVANMAYNGDEFSKNTNMVRGSLYAFFSFLVPNVFMSRVLNFKSMTVNFIAGVIFIFCLDLSVRTAAYYYDKHIADPVKNTHDSERVDDNT
jgi:hypothetical protein